MFDFEAFFYYDYFHMLDMEIQFIWARPTNFSSGLFFLNRYLSFFGNIVMFLSIFVPPSNNLVSLDSWIVIRFCDNYHPPICGNNRAVTDPWEKFHEYFQAMAQTIVAGLLSLRVYALYGHDKRLKIALPLTVLVGVGIVMVTFSLSGLPPTLTLFKSVGCHEIFNQRSAIFNSIGWALVLVYDALLFGMTLFKAHRARYESYGVKLPGGQPSLFTIMVQDGDIYFGVVASVNLINVLSYYVSLALDTLSMWHDALLRGNTMSTLASCTSVTLMSRLMLHLHEIADQGIYVSHGDTVVRRISRNPQSDDSDELSDIIFDGENHHVEGTSNTG
ncbi:hypothetical protein F5880DRAFT_1618484 [Lentinula raphanica]|nr:hypothetical protein F5880DRAFT_1618484 [Lentinula raphanica]